MSLAMASAAANASALSRRLDLRSLTVLLLCLFVFTIPWEKGLWVGSLGTIAKAAGMAAFLCGAASVALRRTMRPPPLALMAAALFVAWSALSWLWSVDPAATLSRSATFAQLLAMFWLLWEFCRSPERQRLLMMCFVLGALTGAVIAYVRYALNLQTYYRRYAATGFDPNTFGLMMALAVPIALYLAFRTPGLRRCWLYLAALVLMGAVVLSASRTALLVVFLVFLFPLLRWRQLRWPDRSAVAALLLLLSLGLAQWAPAPARQRLSTIPAEITTGTLNSRKQIWKAGARAWLEHPVLGVGAGAYPEAVVPWLGRPTAPGMINVAHNTFLSVLVEGGLIGLALFSLLLACLCASVWMMPSPERALWLVVLTAWAAGVLTLTWEQHKLTWLIFGLISAQAGSAWPLPRLYTGGKQPPQEGATS